VLLQCFDQREGKVLQRSMCWVREGSKEFGFIKVSMVMNACKIHFLNFWASPILHQEMACMDGLDRVMRIVSRVVSGLHNS
jgi:hypothetical protein